ncbi:MAG: HNH endonuclease [Lentimicrobiaceae bacterium]|nr:HNH endonuclease [Lentimicrobiaceae bacterium]
MEKIKTDIPLNYITIKTTKSRIDKGLLAIPVSLIEIFPKSADKIYLIDENGKEEKKSFTPYNSSSRECRIGGLKNFYEKYEIFNGDELVIQLLDDKKYMIIPEKIFGTTLMAKLHEFEKIDNEKLLDEKLSSISKFANLSKKDILKNEFIRLSSNEVKKRKTITKQKITTKENVPFALRKILLNLYEGKCQVSNFTFLMKNGLPYFELHHIDALKGNHLKNLIVVSPNVHAQFTYANLEQKFDNDGWLREVKFNDNLFKVSQIIDKLPKYFEKEVHF